MPRPIRFEITPGSGPHTWITSFAENAWPQPESRIHRVGEPVEDVESLEPEPVDDEFSYLRSDRNRADLAVIAGRAAAQDTTRQCETCNCDLAPSEAYCHRRPDSSSSQRWFCKKCYYDRFIACTGCNIMVDMQARSTHQYDFDHSNECGETQHYCTTCYERYFSVCCDCDTRVPSNTMRQSPYGDMFCRTCYEHQCATCSDCGNSVFQRDAHWVAEEPLCGNCAASMDEWDIGKFVCENPTFDRIKTKRQFGVELETSRCDSHWELFNCTIWGCTYDCSIGGKEFISPPLIGDQGLDEIHRFCADMRNRDWTTDDRCGLHIHFDMSDLTDDQLFSIAYAYRLTWNMWKRFVSRERGGNNMCGSPRFSIEDIRTTKNWEYFVGARDRFEYVNWRAFFKHGTFEVRLGEPTLKGADIEAWLVTHAMFLEHVKDMTYKQIDLAFGNGDSATRAFSFCARYIWHDSLVTYLRDLTRRFHDRRIQVRLTYPEHAAFEEA